MTAFDSAWLLLKDFRHMGGFPGILIEGGYDPKDDTPFVNLGSRVAGFRDMRGDDEALIDAVLRILGHEFAHQAMHPPYTDDLWNEVSMRGLKEGEHSEEEIRRLQAKVDDDWERMQEYGAWAATPGISGRERAKALSYYPSLNDEEIREIAERRGWFDE